jgi:CheY-like chemotaxis protein
MVKGLVDLHGFQLAVHSDGPGRGAVFRVDFPLTAAPDAQPPESSFEARGLELLLVEDNPDVAETLAELLAASGHSVETVSSGEQALTSLRSHRPAIVLCDIGLPGMDGLTLARQVRSDPALADVQLVAMTGYSDAATRERMEQAGFARLLIKPVQLSALHHCLARLGRERMKALTRQR